MSSVPPASERRPRRINRPIVALIAVGVALVAVVVVVVVVHRESVSRVQGAVSIPASGGVTLAGQAVEPSGGGKHPLVVMPASFGQTSVEYAAVARRFVAAGFVAVSYTQRGFGNSGGTIDLAGPATQRDARTVIDWALRHTAADATRIGMLGVSYGAGISLLTAAHDKRVRAVAALSTWTDLAAAFHPDDTTSVSGLGSLLVGQHRLSSALQTLSKTLQTAPFVNGGDLDAFSRTRSPLTYVAALNANRPAVMLANGWQDSLLRPGPLVGFYDRLTTPKRLQFAVGDHGGPEQDGLAGKPDATVDDAIGWLRHYVAGTDNGIQKQAPVRLEDVATHQIHTYRSWPTASRVGFLGAPTASGGPVTTTARAWTASVTTGTDTVATSGPSQYGVASAYKIPTAALATVPTGNGVGWAGPPVPAATLVAGTPTVTFDVASASPAASLFTYVYDTAADGTAELMTSAPYTATGLRAGVAEPVTVTLEPIAWTVPAGHHVTVVVDTVEPRWFQAAAAGTTITVSSSAAAPASVGVPIP